MAVLVCKCIPQRYLVVILTFLGLTISYVMRFSFSMSITAMAPQQPRANDSDSCPELISEDEAKKPQTYDFDWNSIEQGNIKSAFFWGYILTQVPGGIMADRWGAKPFILYPGLITAILTIVTPFTAVYMDIPGMIVIRAIIGLVQGVQYAALHAMVAQWVPIQERSTWGGFMFAGSHFGNVVSMLGTGLIIGNDNRNWPWTFYIFGGLGVLWSIFYFLFTSSSPDGHKFLSEKEKEILDEYREGVVSETQWPPIKDIFKNAAVWAAIIASFGHDWGMFVLVIDLPKYTASILHLSIQMVCVSGIDSPLVLSNGLILSCGYFLVFIVAIISGYPADILIEKKITGRTLNRIIFTTIASGGPAIGLLAAAYSGCNQVLVCACLLIGMASMGTFYVSLKVNLIDLSPKYAGFIGSVGNGIGTLAGVLVPIVNGFLTPNSNVTEWRHVMWVAFGIMWVTNVVYIMWASAEIQPFNEK